jgi:hypothetical protein
MDKRYTHKTSYPMTSKRQERPVTNRPVFKTSGFQKVRLQNVRFQNVLSNKYFKMFGFKNVQYYTKITREYNTKGLAFY